MIEVRKNDNETSLNLLRRFTKRVQQSSVLQKARNLQFKKRPESDSVKKKRALKRAKGKAKMSLLWKLGKIEKKTETKR
jgi:ribosomal protein S21